MKSWRVEHSAWAAEKRKIEGDRNIGLSVRRDRIRSLGDEPEKPLSPFLVIGDLTVEGLTKNWSNAHASLGIFTAEGAMFTAGHGMNDDNRLKTAAMLSELWDGKPVKRVRALDGVSILPGRRLSVHVMIQPDAAGVFLSNCTLRDQGLLSRLLTAAPTSMAGSRLYRDTDPDDTAAVNSYGARLLSILEAAPAISLGTRNELDPPARPIAPDAAMVWRAFYDHIETQSGLGSDLAPIQDFAAKAAEHAARIAGVMTIIEDLYAQKIGVETMRDAVTLVDWYVNEALRLQQVGKIDPRLRRAAMLLEWLQSQPNAEASISRILTYGPSSMRTKTAVEEALAILASHGRITQVSDRPRVVKVIGRRRS
jgi:hypothetical protein